MLQNFRPVLSESSDKEIGRILSKAREPLASVRSLPSDRQSVRKLGHHFPERRLWSVSGWPTTQESTRYL